MTNRVNLIEYALEINSFFAPYRQPEAVRQVVLRGAAVDGDRRQEERGGAARGWEGRHSSGRDTYSAARCNVVGLNPDCPLSFPRPRTTDEIPYDGLRLPNGRGERDRAALR